jgi:hypothetical protein
MDMFQQAALRKRSPIWRIWFASYIDKSIQRICNDDVTIAPLSLHDDDDDVNDDAFQTHNTDLAFHSGGTELQPGKDTIPIVFLSTFK